MPALNVQSGGLIKPVKQSDWEKCLSGSSLPVFAEFWATWCGPCKVMAPLIESLAREYNGKVNFVRVDVDESPELVAKFQVFSVPTFIILVNSEPVKRFVGMATKGYVESMLKQHMGG